jgi:predicted MFS family arabinose efflux permease
MKADRPAEDVIPWSHDRRVSAVVLLAGISCALHIGKLPVAIPALKETLGLNLLQAGFLLSLVQLAGLSLGLVVGLAADRLGARRVMMAGLVLLAVGSVIGATARDVPFLLASRVLEGLGFLWSVLPAPAVLRQEVRRPEQLSRALGWWGAYMPMGTALALLAGGGLIGLIGWRALWLMLAGVSLLAALALRAWVPARPLPAVAAGRGQGLWPSLSRTLRAPGPWVVALAFFLYSGQWMAVIGFLPTIYQQAGQGGWLLGALTALAAGINMSGNIGAGRMLARHTAPHRLLLAGYLAMGVGGWMAFQANTLVLQYLGVLLFSALGGLVPGTLFGIAVRLAPGADTVSTTVGWMQQWSAFGQFVGPPVVAALAVFTGGWASSWWFTVSCSLAGGLIALWLSRLWSRHGGVAQP